MSRRMAVLGAGAIGSSVAADLLDAGYDLTIFDQWPAQIEAIRTQGLHVTMPDRDVRVRPSAHHLCDLAALDLQFDLVLMAVKSYDTRWHAELIAPYLAPEGWFVGVQNGMNDDTLAGIVGRERVVGCCVELSAEIFSPGSVQRNTPRHGTWFGLGELDGKLSKRIYALEEMFRNIGKVTVTSNIYGTKWTKLITNSMTMGPFGLLGMKNWEAKELPGMFDLSVKIGRESLAVGTALGYRMEPIFGLLADDFAGDEEEMLSTVMKTLMAHVGRHSRTAPIHDHIKGRRSEMAFISGLVARKADELGIAAPCNAAVAQIDRLICTRQLQMQPANYERLQKMLAPAGSGWGQDAS